MKKPHFVSLALLCILISSSCFSQISGGILGGMNFSKINPEGYYLGDFKGGYLVGGYFSVKLNEKWSLQPELYYSNMGARSPSSTTKLGYISFPILAKYNFNKTFNIHAGPQLNFLTSAKEVLASDFKIDQKGVYSDLDAGITLGIGADIKRFNFGIRYYKGITGYLNVRYTSPPPKLNNSSFQIVAGYRLFGK